MQSSLYYTACDMHLYCDNPPFSTWIFFPPSHDARCLQEGNFPRLDLLPHTFVLCPADKVQLVELTLLYHVLVVPRLIHLWGGVIMSLKNKPPTINNLNESPKRI